MSEIYFVRHGQSEANVKGVFAGQKDNSKLTETGKEQAKKIAVDLLTKKLNITRIVSSPLARTHETAEIIVKEAGLKLEIEVDKRILEYDMGSLTSTPIRKVTSKELTSAENAENPIIFMARVHNLLNELSNSEDNVLIISHAGVGRIIDAKKNNIDPFSFYDLDPYPNAEIIRLK